jgi:hypothetical protein
MVTSSQTDAGQRKRSADVGDETSTRKSLPQPGKKAKSNPKSPRSGRSNRRRLYVSIYEADPLTSLYCRWGLFLQSHNGKGDLHEFTGTSQPMSCWVYKTSDAVPEDMDQV